MTSANTVTNPRKAYVGVDVRFDLDGHAFPHSLTWENGRLYVIDQVLAVESCSGFGSLADRYTIRIQGRQRYLYYEPSLLPAEANVGRWFVERKCA